MSKIEHSTGWSSSTSFSLSVCIPTHNPDLVYLTALMQSIEAIDIEGIELVLSDDNSTDPAPIRHLLENCSVPWTAIWADEALGMASNWNRASAHASGEFTLVTGQDDLIVGHNLGSALAAARDAQAGLVLSAARYVDSAGTLSGNPSSTASAERVFDDYPLSAVSTQALTTAALLYGNVLGDPCHTIFSTKLFKELNGFSSEYEHAVDLELWLRMLASGAAAIRVPYEIGAHRQHAGAATAGHVRNGSAQRDRLRLVESYGTALPTSAWNRAVARLHSHRLNDRLRHNTPFQPLTAPMRGNLLSRLREWASEALETTGVRKPSLGRYVASTSSEER